MSTGLIKNKRTAWSTKKDLMQILSFSDNLLQDIRLLCSKEVLTILR